MKGLSPRLRGNPRWSARRSTRTRSIPAPAGEPSCCRACPWLPGVYPRACGGTRGHRLHQGEPGGLSPRLRGNQGFSLTGRANNISIPAPAGEPGHPLATSTPYRVYPRACGGTPSGAPTVIRVGGLSPRLRGNLKAAGGLLHLYGSIPAPAGEPNSLAGKPPLRRVYPRACGGTGVDNRRFVLGGGLSPRLRGNLRLPTCWRTPLWSIPAPAGEPSRIQHSVQMVWVYPRACGGTLISLGFHQQANGLSPRLRGNLVPLQ